MDRPLKRQETGRRYRLIAAGLVGLVIIGWLGISYRSHSVLSIAKDRLTVTTVGMDRFFEYINLNGQIAPARTRFIDCRIAGSVAQVYVESGQQVAQGDTLLKIDNADLELEVLQREAELIEQLNNQRQTELLLNQNNFNQRAQLVEIKFDIELLTKQHARSKELHLAGLMAASEFEPIDNRFSFLLARSSLLQQAYQNDSLARYRQLEQIRESEYRILESLSSIRELLDRLFILAPQAGLISDFSLTVGQSLIAGQRLGEIYCMDDPQIITQVDEYYLDKISVGQQGLSLINGDTVPLVVEKIYPTVADGLFQVEVGLTAQASAPAFVKGQSIRLRLLFGEATQSTLLANGNFYNATGGNWIYLVKEDQAVRIPIELGRRNPNFHEVISGLQAGDQVITSDYATFKNFQTLKFK